MSTIAKLRRQGIEILRYLWVAVLATGVNLASATFYRAQFGMGLASSLTLGYATGTLVGFVLSRTFTFKERTSSHAGTESIKYLFVTCCAWLVSLGAAHLIIILLNEVFTLSPALKDSAVSLSSESGQQWLNREFIANIGGIGCGFFVNFFGHKFLTFRKTDVLNRLRGKLVA